MKAEKATIFYRPGVVTYIDYATIDNYGKLVGGSFAPGITVTGPLNEGEEVVMDFSTCKKVMKGIIDSKEFGIDHKLVIGSWSLIDNVVISDDTVTLVTRCHVITVPSNAIYFHSVNHFPSLNNETSVKMGEVVARLLRKHMDPKLTIDVEEPLLFMQVPGNNSNVFFFRYTHGLKNSTSWGCQNIAHGHLSYISMRGDYSFNTFSRITKDLTDVRFICADDIECESNGDLVESYTTERGEFTIVHKDFVNKNIVILESETTIENIGEYVRHKYFSNEEDYCIEISEGLSKGVLING